MAIFIRKRHNWLDSNILLNNQNDSHTPPRDSQNVNYDKANVSCKTLERAVDEDDWSDDEVEMPPGVSDTSDFATDEGRQFILLHPLDTLIMK